MGTSVTHPLVSSNQLPSAKLGSLISNCEKMLQRYWEENSDLYHLIQLKKQQSIAANEPIEQEEIDGVAPAKESPKECILDQTLRGSKLRAKIRESHHEIQQRSLSLNAEIVPRTQAYNRKCSYQTIEEEQSFRGDLLSAQIKSWRALLPRLIKRFSKIPDYRRTNSVTHKITVLMMFGLFSFIFRMSSRREMNRELTSPVIYGHLKKLFPEIDSIPHADTLARVLENINPKEIESIHIHLIKDLIINKKFKKLLIHGCLPITIDGTQKLYRDGLQQNERWCERKVGSKDSDDKQQYINVVEANITLKNGLNIPLMTEYMRRENNQLIEPNGKQDSETTAFERLAARLKKYFPRLKIIIFADAMYATQTAMGIMHQYRWEYIIRLPKNKLTELAKLLNQSKSISMPIPGQRAYRRRKQQFHWVNDVCYGYDWQLKIALVACQEQYDSVDMKTGEIKKCFVEHCWISSVRFNINKAHEYFNLGARKKELMEDGINTEKNRGYHYKHAFSYNWNAMQGFHYLMRLAHAVNALSEFTKSLKKYIKSLGVSAILKLIKETLFSPWLSKDWYETQGALKAELRLQLE